MGCPVGNVTLSLGDGDGVDSGGGGGGGDDDDDDGDHGGEWHQILSLKRHALCRTADGLPRWKGNAGCPSESTLAQNCLFLITIRVHGTHPKCVRTLKTLYPSVVKRAVPTAGGMVTQTYCMH